MKEAFTIYVEDDEELLCVVIGGGVKGRDNRFIQRYFDPCELKEYEGCLIKTDRVLPVKDGEC